MNLLIQFGKSRLLALLLVFLSNAILCCSFPTHEIADRSDSFEKRAPNVYQAFLEDLHSSITVDVPQGQEKFLAFGSGASIIGSDGFTGCIGLIIGGHDGVIMAHYANSVSDLKRAADKLPGLINNHKGLLGGAQAYLFSEVHPHTDTWESEESNQKLESIVHSTLGIDTTRVKYIQPENLIDFDNFNPDCFPEIIYGGILVKHPGGQRGGWQGFFVDSVLQKAIFEGGS
ncbi:hypothetical protein N7492_004701 [Penicillium capsulatum]|uniref:Uncharacterized protein n=1 Tax=Penicillium capsulatum TaxID=69766 RepID=A0A9W9IAG4_9EURO|nr:hypothetical protein N7492_004701 [Penicillium capsulatum]KAJ6136190.1 hypothetical protein N7512_001350 [Penicillium capsulatum]